MASASDDSANACSGEHARAMTIVATDDDGIAPQQSMAFGNRGDKPNLVQEAGTALLTCVCYTCTCNK